MIKKNIEMIALIYKSVEYLDFIVDQLKSDCCKVPGWDVGFRIVANDASPKIMEHLKKLGVPHSEYKDKNPTHYWMDRIYRAWSWAGATSSYDNFVFINSDMMFSNGWLTNLLKHHDGTNIPCSWLVESGKCVSDTPPAISKNFGTHPKNIKVDEFRAFAETIKKDELFTGGTYMPCVLERARFMEAGMYPEGNLYWDPSSITGKRVGWLDRPLPPPGAAISGDKYFFHDILEQKFGMKHVTVMDSICYHIQVGEMDSND